MIILKNQNLVGFQKNTEPYDEYREEMYNKNFRTAISNCRKIATSLEHHLSDWRDIIELGKQHNVLDYRMVCVSSCYYKLYDILSAMKKDTANAFTQFDNRVWIFSTGQRSN